MLSMLSCMLVLALGSLALVSTPLSAAAQSADATTTGASRAFNPALSLNALILGQYLDGAAPDPAADGALEEGFSVQELELRFTAAIDAYARADATISGHGDEIAIEQAYADLLTLPAGLGLRAGQFLAPFSRENSRHTHQLPFVQRSLGLSSIFPDGFAAPGVMLSWLPAIPVYTELSAAALDGSSSAFFGSDSDGGLVGMGQIQSLVDLSESTTFGLQASAGGGNNSAGRTSQLASAGLDLRWKPTRRTIYRSLRVGAEYTWADRPGDFGPYDTLHGLAGISAWTAVAQYQFARRWWVSGRHDWLDPTGGTTATRWGANVSFVASEFQALRLEFTSTDDGTDNRSNSVFLQYNITIGSHPAHLY